MTEKRRPTREERVRKLRRLRRVRKVGRFGLWSVVWVSALAALAGFAVLLIIDQTLRAPEWLRDRVEMRLEENLGGLQLDFGAVELVIGNGWRPRAALRNVQLSDADGRSILSLRDAEASLAMRPLLRGEMQPKQISLSGAFAVLRRDAAGAFSLAFDGSDTPLGEGLNLPGLVGALDGFFEKPELSALVDVTLDQVNLRYEDAVSGQAWTVDGGSARLGQEDGQLRIAGSLALLTGRDFASSLEVNYSSPIGDQSATIGLTLTDVPARDIASQSVALSWLEPLRAPLSGALRGGIDAEGALLPLNATLQIGKGVLQPNEQSRPIPFEAARTYFTFDPAQREIRFDEIFVDSDWVSGTAEGITVLEGIEQGTLSGLLGQLRLTTTQLNPNGAYDAPVTLNGVAADFKLQLDPFTLSLGEVYIEDQGNELHLDGALSATDEGWQVAVNGQMDALTPERLIDLWPAAAIPNTRRWIARNLSGGELSDVNLALRVASNEKPNVYIDFDYADTEVRFMRTMPPITGATGHASLIGNRFVTTATAGTIIADEGGAVDVSGTSFIVPDTSIRRAAPAVVRVQGRGSITSVLSLLNREPLKVLERPGLPADVADGTAVFSGTLALPLKDRVTFDEVEFYANALARNVASAVLVPNQVVEAPTLNIAATDEGVEISGQGLLSNVPFLANWRQIFGVPGAGSELTGTIELSAQTLEAFEIGLPEGAVSGEGRGEIVLALPQGGPPQLKLTSDLQGLQLSLPELGWSKPPERTGRLELEAELAAPAVVPRLELDAPGLSATGRIEAAAGGGLKLASFSRVRRSDWMDVQAQLIGRGANRPPDVRIAGGRLDLRRATFGAPRGSAGSGAADNRLVANLDQLQVTDTIALNAFEGDFTLLRGLEGNFSGRINGQTPVTGSIVPDAGRSAVRVLSDDAGGVFRDAGLLRQAYGGSFDMILRPVGEPGNFDGSITVKETSVRDAPAIAALLNAISIVGLLNELAGQGIFFSDVAARFRMSPSRITLYESRATGPSLGLTMDGIYDVPSQQLNMQGVISPVYLLNQIGGLLAPRRGEGLFGFTYTLTGPAQSPQVGVNPLSGLTPGIFREIFRTQPPPVASSSGDAPIVQEGATPTAPAGGNR